MILINPQGQKLGDFYRYLPVSPPVGIGILAGYLLSQNKNVKILDENVISITDSLLDNIVRDLSRPYIFGISCVTAATKRGYDLTKIIKAKYPDSIVIMGGIHPTVLPEEALDTGFVDIVVRAEGEETLNLLYEVIKKERDYTAIPGISFKKKDNIVHNPPARLFPDLDLLPLFPYYLFEEQLDKYNFGFISSSRGCPHNCIFCSQRFISGRKYRYVSPERVTEEIDLLINKYNQKSIVFVDDDFTINKKRIEKLCVLMHKKKFYKKAKFHCQARGDSVDIETFEYLRMAGFRFIDFGIETASERLMNLINKDETVEDNIKAVRLAKKFGFRVSATFIFGLPTETDEERWQAYTLAKKLDLDYARFNNATPYPGTRLFEIAKEESRLHIEKDWSNINACGSLVKGYFSKSKLAYVPKTTTEKKLSKDIFKANILFYLRPKSILRILKEGMIPPGWFVLPKYWFIKPKEWYYIIRLLLRLLIPKRDA